MADCKQEPIKYLEEPADSLSTIFYYTPFPSSNLLPLTLRLKRLKMHCHWYFMLVTILVLVITISSVFLFWYYSMIRENKSLYTSTKKACSCYSFECGGDRRLQWREAKESCDAKGKHLAVLETDSEWQFITNEINSRNTTDKWHIGLFHTCKNWTWINGKPLKPTNGRKGSLNLVTSAAVLFTKTNVSVLWIVQR